MSRNSFLSDALVHRDIHLASFVTSCSKSKRTILAVSRIFIDTLAAMDNSPGFSKSASERFLPSNDGVDSDFNFDLVTLADSRYLLTHHSSRSECRECGPPNSGPGIARSRLQRWLALGVAPRTLVRSACLR